MESRGLKIAGGVIEIVAGAFWLLVSLLINNIGNVIFGKSLEIIQIIMPMLFIYFGIMSCTRKAKKSDYTTFGILNMAFIGLQFYYGTYVGLGIVQIVLLFIAGMLFFFVKPTQDEIDFKTDLVEYRKNEPNDNRFHKKLLFGIGLALSLLVNIFVIISCIGIKTSKGTLSVDGMGLSVIGLIAYVGILIYFIIYNKKQSSYKMTANLIWTSIAIIPTFLFNMFLVSTSTSSSTLQMVDQTTGEITQVIQNTTSTINTNGIFVAIISILIYVFITLATYSVQYSIECSKTRKPLIKNQKSNSRQDSKCKQAQWFDKYVIFTQSQESKGNQKHLCFMGIKDGEIKNHIVINYTKIIKEEDKEKIKDFISDSIIVGRYSDILESIGLENNPRIDNEFDIRWAEERFADKINKIKETINKEWNEYKTSLDPTQEINLVGCSFIFVEVETYKYIFEKAKI